MVSSTPSVLDVINESKFSTLGEGKFIIRFYNTKAIFEIVVDMGTFRWEVLGLESVDIKRYRGY